MRVYAEVAEKSRSLGTVDQAVCRKVSARVRGDEVVVTGTGGSRVLRGGSLSQF